MAPFWKPEWCHLRWVAIVVDFVFSVGDDILLSCEAESTHIERVVGGYVFVKWPWNGPELNSNMVWDGTVALPRSPESREWANTPWRMEPDPVEVVAGEPCLVGIPPTKVRLQGIEISSVPRETGWLPRPSFAIVVMPVVEGRPLDEDAGFRVFLASDEPIEVEPG